MDIITMDRLSAKTKCWNCEVELNGKYIFIASHGMKDTVEGKFCSVYCVDKKLQTHIQQQEEHEYKTAKTTETTYGVELV